MVYTVERFISEAEKGNMVMVEGYVKSYDTRPPYQKGGHSYRNVTITSGKNDHSLPEVTVTLIDNECTKIEDRGGEFITFSGKVSQYQDKPKKLSKARIVNDTNIKEQMLNNDKQNGAKEKSIVRQSLAKAFSHYFDNATALMQFIETHGLHWVETGEILEDPFADNE